MKKRDQGTGIKKVLMIVEDFDSIRNLIGRYFQVDGFDVISAGNMHEAMAIGEHEQPNIIIVDFDMSNDPYVIVQVLHSLLPLSQILVVNGRNRQCNIEEATVAGASRILDRKYNPSVLEEIVHGELRAVHS